MHICSLKNGENVQLHLEAERIRRELAYVRSNLEEEKLKFTNREREFREEKEQAIRQRVRLLEVFYKRVFASKV